MANKKDLKDARELLDLDVKEVSLVDRPANLRPFLVVKRQAEDHAGVFEADYSADVGGELETTVAKLDGEFAGELSEVVEWMAKRAAEPGAPTESINTVALYLGKVAANCEQSPKQSIQGGELVDVKKTETVDMIKARHAYEVATLKAGTSDETKEDLEKRQKTELDKADATTDKVDEKKKAEAEAKAKAEAEAAAKAKAKTEKADDGKPESAKVEKAETPATDPDDEPAVVIKRDGSVHVAGQVVQKAKTFGKNRTAALSNAVGALAKLLGDVDETALKSALSDLADPTKKVDGKVATKKADESGSSSNAILDALNTALEPIQKRLDEIEKTRNPSQSADAGGGTDKTTPVEKSMWSGVL